ncbi:hypothetical protein GQ457_17G016190 [Hibiscus cannabinus]
MPGRNSKALDLRERFERKVENGSRFGHIYFTGYLVDMMSLNYLVVCVNDDMLHTTISLTRVRSHGYVLMAMDITWFCKSLRALRPIVSLKRPHFNLT